MSDETIQVNPQYIDLFRAYYPLTETELWDVWRSACQLDQTFANVPNPYGGVVLDFRTMLSGFMTVITQLITIRRREARGLLTSLSFIPDDQTVAMQQAFSQLTDAELTLLLSLLEQTDAMLANFPDTGWESLSLMRQGLQLVRDFALQVQESRVQGDHPAELSSED